MTRKRKTTEPYDESDEWKEFVDHVRKDALEKIAGSVATISLVPEGKVDIKFAVELGLSIMLDKPILALVMPGTTVPAKLRKVVDRVVVADIDTEEGKQFAGESIERFLESIG